MSSLQYDEELVLSNDLMMKAIAGDNLGELVSKRRKMPLTAVHVWKDNRMRQNDIFSKPLVDEMCTGLQNVYKVEFPRMIVSQQMRPMKLDLNSTPAAGVLDLNLTPEDDGLLDLNSSPPQDEPIQDQHGGLSGVPDPNSSATHDEPIQDQHGGLSGLPGGVPREVRKNLTSQERYGVYFALKVIERRDGKFTTCDKELVASMLHTSVRSIERVWKTAQEQLEQGLPISSKKKGKCGGKRKDLDLSRTSTIPLNRRRTIRSLAKSLGVSRSTLHRRFRLGELKRVSDTLKPSMTEANKIQRLQHCLSTM